MPRSQSGPTPEQFAARLRALILAKAPLVRDKPSLSAAHRIIAAHYPDLMFETLQKYLAPRKAHGETLPPQVPSGVQIYKIITPLGISPADLFAPFEEE